MIESKRKRGIAEDRDDYDRSARITKKAKLLGRNHYDDISNELVLRIFSFLPVNELVNIERVCERFRRLSTDNTIWREKFYEKYVFPRMRRLPSLAGLAASKRDAIALQHAYKVAKWQEKSEKYKQKTDWKHWYKVKLNWSKGRCISHEVPLDCPAQPRLLVRVFQGVTITASKSGLQTYTQQVKPQLLTSQAWEGASTFPTALAVSAKQDDKIVIIGFDDGHLEVYCLDTRHLLRLQCKFTVDAGVAITDLAVTWPYLLLVSGSKIRLIEMQAAKSTKSLFSAITLADLQSIGTVSLTSLSIRRVSAALIASIAYPFHRLHAGYCLGIQEIRIDLTGKVLASRLTSTVDTPFEDLPLKKQPQVLSRAASTAPFPLHPQLMHAPNSLSHAGCYVLAGLPDNTLMVYTVTSTPEKLEISAGRRLWGHTSSISGTEVSDRGKALSVSVKGDEIRVWELEDILSAYTFTSTPLKPRPSGDVLATALAKRGNGLGLTIREMKHELAWTRHWVGFDEEQVVVLGERDEKQILSCFTFA